MFTHRKILFYISTMMAFKQIARTGDKKKIQDRLNNVPSIVVDGLLSRFTETARESNELSDLCCTARRQL